jgi:hypothetical protein
MTPVVFSVNGSGARKTTRMQKTPIKVDRRRLWSLVR